LKPDALQLVRGTAADIPFVMATERRPGYEHLVGRWDDAQHRTALSEGRYAYFIARAELGPIGFAILRDWASRERVTLIQRFAVCDSDRGNGKAMLAKLVERIFNDTDAYRISLGLFPDNARARRVYEAVGFQAEGIARGSAFFGGIHRDELIMALLRPDWPRADQVHN
jgi:RimJ/RimL family protein N-acetyltransferase